MRITNIYRLGRKELSSLAYDPVLVILILYAFSLAIYAPAKGVRIEVTNAAVAYVDEDRSALSRQIIAAIPAPYFRAPEAIELSEVEAALERGRYSFVIDIPPNFLADLRQQKRPQVQINVDATTMTEAGVGSGYLENIIQEEVARFLGLPPLEDLFPVTQVVRILFNPNTQSSWFLGVMQIVNMTTLLAIVLTGAAFIREREHGTLEHLLVMPLTPAEIVLAKVWANALVIVIAALASLLIIVRGVLQVPVTESLPLFLVGLVVYLLALTAIGLYLATLARSMPQFGLLSIPLFLFLYMLSGAITPLESMPEPLQWLMQFSPTTHFVAYTQAVIFRHAPISMVWPHWLALAGISLVFFLGALKRFRKTVTLTRL